MAKRIGAVPSKLNDEQRLICVRMYAEGVSLNNICSYLKTEWNIDFTDNGMYGVVRAKKYELHLKRFKEEYFKRIKDVPIANKRIRIDDLESIRKKIVKVLDDNPCETKNQREEFRYMVRTLNDTIINAREEMEKKPNLIAGLGIVGDLGEKSDDELIAERDEILAQARRIIPRAASEGSRDSEGTTFEDSGESA